MVSKDVSLLYKYFKIYSHLTTTHVSMCGLVTKNVLEIVHI